jgi:uncharacterized protein YbjT (DUF2867 family)
METKKALIAGASGLIGKHCLRFLLDEPSYTRVTALVRSKLEITHPKLVQQVIDFDEIETIGEALSAEDVYCCLGTTIKKAGTQDAFQKVDFTYPVKLAALTQHCDAQQFLIVTSLGADPHSRIFYNRVKAEVEEAVRKIPFNAFHIFRPSLLLGDRSEHRTGEKTGAVIMSVLKPVMIGPLRKLRAIQASDVAKAMVRVAQIKRTGVNIYESDQIQKIADE